MSFIGTIVHGIGRAADFLVSKSVSGAATGLKVAAPFVAMINPAAGAIMNRVGGIIVGVEAMITAEKEGVLKKETVSQIARREVPLLEDVIAEFGPKVDIPEKEMGDFIDATVAQYNAADKLLQAIKAANPTKKTA